MRTISLHDTRTGRLTEVRPREPGKIGIYACGPTVYARIHIGNARPFVVFSLLRRFLRSEGYEATLVINVTDVNDKIYDAARAEGRSATLLEQQYVVVTLLRDVVDRGLNVAIGTETGIERLADCSVVVAPYEVNGEPAGTIGLLGPTRMHYPEAIATVAVVSRRLGQSLTAG